MDLNVICNNVFANKSLFLKSEIAKFVIVSEPETVLTRCSVDKGDKPRFANAWLSIHKKMLTPSCRPYANMRSWRRCTGVMHAAVFESQPVGFLRIQRMWLKAALDCYARECRRPPPPPSAALPSHREAWATMSVGWPKTQTKPESATIGSWI